MARAKYSMEQRLMIGKRIYDKELNISVAGLEYGISFYTARDYYRLYKAHIDRDPAFEEVFRRNLLSAQAAIEGLLEDPSETSQAGGLK